jgi:hypothetical protein
MSKSIYNYNTKGKNHGYQEMYWTTTNQLRFRGCHKHGMRIGYMEWHNRNWNCTKVYIR